MSKTTSEPDAEDETGSWDIVDVVTSRLDLNKRAVRNTVKLLAEDNTVPFIARYRKDMTMNMSVDNIRNVKEQYEELLVVQSKAAAVMKAIDKIGKLTKELKSAIKAAQDVKEIEYLYTPYKAGSKRSYAERAREAGLEPMSLKVLKAPQSAYIQSAVKPDKEGISTLAEVEKGIQHIIADIISKDKDTLDKIRSLCQSSPMTIETTKSKSTSKKENEPNQLSYDAEQKIHKFDLYFNFSTLVTYVRPHQMLAINRGENLKILSVKIVIPDNVKRQFVQFCCWRGSVVANSQHKKLFLDSVEDCYSRLLAPMMIRHCRSDLTKKAEKASVEVFSSNLKRLLLTPPVRGRIVLGLDPGFKNGCKYAVTAISGKVLETGVLYLHTHHADRQKEREKLQWIVRKNNCDTIAVGNGTACRETETILSDMIKIGSFKPHDVKYCIVNENGASIYSASPAAEQELPDMDVTLRGAVSIARRLQDPLAELVKIEPKHIGVGMYQHDLAENALNTALDGVVEECVSFVGVDVNVGSELLLRRVAGLNATRAKKIIEWRETKGPFICRSQLCAIKGFGPKTYEQCAGFIRVLPETRGKPTETEVVPESTSVKVGRKRKAPAASASAAKRKKKEDLAAGVIEPLDMTAVHPESYHVANRLIAMANVDKEHVGQASFISSLNSFVCRNSVKELADQFEIGEPALKQIVDGLLQPLGHDIREGFEKPLFKQSLTSLSDLKMGTVLTGRVTNTTHFGSFVDIGVGRNALLHNRGVDRQLLGPGKKGIELGDRVEVAVESLDLERGRIGLRLRKLL